MVTVNSVKIAERTHTCINALDRHSRCTVRCNKRPLYTGTNTRYASMHTNSVSKQHAWNYFIQTQTNIYHPNFGDVAVGPDRPMLGLMWAGTLSYSAMKLFSNFSNLCDHGT